MTCYEVRNRPHGLSVLREPAEAVRVVGVSGAVVVTAEAIFSDVCHNLVSLPFSTMLVFSFYFIYSWQPRNVAPSCLNKICDFLFSMLYMLLNPFTIPLETRLLSSQDNKRPGMDSPIPAFCCYTYHKKYLHYHLFFIRLSAILTTEASSVPSSKSNEYINTSILVMILSHTSTEVYTKFETLPAIAPKKRYCLTSKSQHSLCLI